MLRGHNNYFGVTGNGDALRRIRQGAERIWGRSLARSVRREVHVGAVQATPRTLPAAEAAAAPERLPERICDLTSRMQEIRTSGSVGAPGEQSPGATRPEAPDGELTFHALPRLRTHEVADLLQTVRIRVTSLLERRGLLERDGEQLALCADDALADSEPALASLACTAVGTQPPSGPERRKRVAGLPLPGRSGFTVTSSLCVAEHSYSLHAATRAGSHDDGARERLIRYVLRPPLATERLTLLPDELVRLQLEKPFSDGTVAIDLDPLSLLWRLCAAVPPPRRHAVVYSGVLSSHAKWRSRIVHAPPAPAAAPPAPTAAAPAPPPPGTTAPERDATSKRPGRSRRRPRAELLVRSFGRDAALCPHCGGTLRLHALVQDPSSIRRILRHRGEPTDPPPIAPARGPPYRKTKVLLRRTADAQAEPQDEQRDLFHT